MLESESSALPFGDTPIYLIFLAYLSATNDIITDYITIIKHYFLFFITFFEVFYSRLQGGIQFKSHHYKSGKNSIKLSSFGYGHPCLFYRYAHIRLINTQIITLIYPAIIYLKLLIHAYSKDHNIFCQHALWGLQYPEEEYRQFLQPRHY